MLKVRNFKKQKVTFKAHKCGDKKFSKNGLKYTKDESTTIKKIFECLKSVFLIYYIE